jgi:hypothetical protein
MIKHLIIGLYSFIRFFFNSYIRNNNEELFETPEGLMTQQELNEYEKYESYRVNKESKRKIEKKSRVQKDANRKSAKSPEKEQLEKSRN